MAEEKEILIEVSSDGIAWEILTVKPNGSVYHVDDAVGIGNMKYYRAKAVGDNITTSDSDYTEIVSATASYSDEYKAVLDYAIVNTIGTPSLLQNIKNDIMIRQLIQTGKWNSFDVFYYFMQDEGTPYEFLTLNWKSPSSFRLLNAGSNNVDFIGGSGFKVSGGNSQYFNSQYNPSVHAVNFQPTNSGVIFQLFDAPTTFNGTVRIIGAASVSTNQVNILSSANNSMLFRHYNSTTAATNIVNSEINSHYQSSYVSGINKSLFLNGQFSKNPNYQSPTGVLNATVDVFSTNYLGIHYPSEKGLGLKYLAWGSSFFYDDNLVYKILNATYTFEIPAPESTLAFTIEDSALPELYFLQIVRSSKFPTIPTTKKYIILYSTDHSGGGSAPIPSNGAIAWGECDNVNLAGFIERGIIIAGYQSETPNLELVEADPDGQVVHLYYHPDTSHPDSGGKQQTRLLTTTGGELHTATWTDRGKVLGITAYEMANYTSIHTGYLVTFKQLDNSFIGVHTVHGANSATENGVPKIGVSTSIDGRTWTRINEDIGGRSIMPYFRQFHITKAFFFNRNGNQYCVGGNTLYNFDFTQTYIAMAQCDGNYNLVNFLGNISSVNSGNGCSNASFYIDDDSPDVLHIYYTMNQTEMYYTSFDLTVLD